jgi:GNAT superfamily N-acetyltransferase
VKANMPHIEFIIANIASHKRELIDLNIEYMNWVFAGVESHFGIPADAIVGVPAAEYVPTVIDKVCGDPPPKGVFYLVKVDGKLAGMGGLRYVRDGVCEIKRVYIRPEFRGMKMGDAMLSHLLADARDFGYARVCLDTGPFMKSAHRLYEAGGFTDCAAYVETEVPAELQTRWRFMERTL